MENVEIAGIAGTKISSKSITKNTNSKKGEDYMSSPFFVNKKLKVLPLDTYQKIPITKGKTFTKFKKKFDITNQLKYSFSQADGLPVSRNLKHNMTKTAPHHTVLFNVAGITMLHLTKHELDQVYDIIECTMNGDGLYEGYDKEDILAGYYHQENPFGHMTWIDLIKMILSENTIRMVCRNTGYLPEHFEMES